MRTNMKRKREKDTRVQVHLVSKFVCRNAANFRHFITDLRHEAIGTNPQ